MKINIFLMGSIVASSKTSSTPARTIPHTHHRWRCSHCGQIVETENNLPPANYNCPTAGEMHAWENYDVTAAEHQDD